MNQKELEKKLNEALVEEHEKSGLISVTSLIYDCLRRAYYEDKIGSFYDKDTLETFWVGKAIHEKQLFDGEAELELQQEGIIGVIDEFIDGTLIEKKSVNIKTWNFIPDHYKKQLNYYYWLMEANGKKVENAFLIFIKKEPPHDKKIIPVKLEPLEKIEKEILEKKEILLDALDRDIPPPQKFDWLCKRCPYASICFKKEIEEINER